MQLYVVDPHDVMEERIDDILMTTRMRKRGITGHLSFSLEMNLFKKAQKKGGGDSLCSFSPQVTKLIMFQ